MPIDSFLRNAVDFVSNIAGADPTGTLGRVQELEGEFAEQVRQFTGHLVRRGMPRWQRHLLEGKTCEMDGCEAVAVDRCIACGTWVCLAHVHVSHLGTGICDQCVREAIERGQRPAGAREEPPRQQGGWSRGTGQWTEAKALRVLGLSTGATDEQVAKAHRKRLAENHPDRARTEAQRVASEAKSKRINEAFAWLKQHRARAA